MQPSTIHRRAGLVLLAVSVMACGGARGPGRPASSTATPVGLAGSPATALPSPVATPPLDASSAPDSAPSAAPAASSLPSTQEASQLLSELEALLRQLDGEIAAADEAATNQGE
jgi:hypothetical protein